MIRILAALLLLVNLLGTTTPNSFGVMGLEGCSVEDFPFQVYLSFKDNKEFSYDCVASIIHNSWVLTTAQCGLLKEKRTVYLKSGGVTSLSKHGNMYNISEVIIHPNYDDNTRDNDAALLKVSQPFVFSDMVQPIQLTRTTPAAETPVTLGGWGDGYPRIVNCAMLTVYPQDACERMHQHSSFKVTSNMLCAGDPDGEKELYCGDIGMGLTTTDRQYLVGIVSWWIGKDMKDKPPVFTDVARIEPWVMSTINSPERRSNINVSVTVKPQ